MTETILQKLLELEQLENIKILYACESGSRAWVLPLLIVILMFALYMPGR